MVGSGQVESLQLAWHSLGSGFKVAKGASKLYFNFCVFISLGFRF